MYHVCQTGPGFHLTRNNSDALRSFVENIDYIVQSRQKGLFYVLNWKDLIWTPCSICIDLFWCKPHVLCTVQNPTLFKPMLQYNIYVL